jgi:SAM-dependent methyltransferase
MDASHIFGGEMNPGREPVDRFVAEIIASGMIPAGGRVLELGTGLCFDRWMLLKDNYQFYPTDKTPCREDIAPLDAENIPDGQFQDMDAIFATELLEHVEFPLKVLENCRNHLKPGGIVAVSLPFMYQIHCDDVVGDYQRLTPDGLASLFRRAGFGTYYADARYKEGEEVNKPSYVVGWGKKAVRIVDWKVALPENWKEIQIAAEAKWKAENPSEKLIS